MDTSILTSLVRVPPSLSILGPKAQVSPHPLDMISPLKASSALLLGHRAYDILYCHILIFGSLCFSSCLLSTAGTQQCWQWTVAPFTLQDTTDKLHSQHTSTGYVALSSLLETNLCKKKNGLLTFSTDNLCKYKCFWFPNLLEDKWNLVQPTAAPRRLRTWGHHVLSVLWNYNSTH